MTIDAEIVGQLPLGPFKFRWPDAYEDFGGGWDFQPKIREDDLLAWAVRAWLRMN